VSRLEQFNKILHDLKMSSTEVEGAALLSDDGLMIASVLPAGLDELHLSAASAVAFATSSRSAAEIGRGAVEELIIRGTSGYAILCVAARNVVLIILAEKSARLGVLLLDVREAVGALNRILL
jgi:predicted regulator of Ras-like GTPase activity (Roadblock/LC7/MglB family)